MTLHLPLHVIAQRRREFEHAVLRNVTIEDARAREYTALLQQITPDMFMVRAHDTIEPGVPLRPGFYHILVRNQDAPMSVMAVHENDRYCEPDSRIFNVLAAGNLRERRVRDAIDREEQDAQTAYERERATAKADRMDRVKEIVDSATRAQISMDRTLPWTQNSDGRARNGRG